MVDVEGRARAGGRAAAGRWYDRGVSGDAARSLHPRFPNLDPVVVQDYLDAPETVVAEIVDGEL